MAKSGDNEMITSTTSRSTGAQTDIEAGTNRIVLDGPADVRLGVPQADIVSSVQVGNDLVVTLTNGEQLIIENFFVPDASGTVSQLIAEGAALPLAGMTSGLVSGGLGLLAAAGVAAAVGSGESQSAAELALATINGYDGTDATTAPTAEDYADAGVTGVSDEALDAVNEAIAASDNDAMTAEDIQAIVDGLASDASDVINGYDGTDATTEPTAEDYAVAGVDVSGATEEQIAALNEAVAASGDDLTAEELQGILDQILADDASDLINGYDGTDPAIAPTAEDYSEAGVDMEGVTDEQVDALNEAVAASGDDDLTAEELQAMVDEIVASDLINGYDGTDATTAPTADDYTTAGVDMEGVTDEQLAALNEAVAASDDADLTTEELQEMLTGIQASDEINDYDGTGEAPTADDYTAAGVDMADVTDEQLAALNEAVAASADDDLTAEELQDMIDQIVAVDAIVDAAIDGDPAIDATVENFTDANVTGVDDTNIDAINDYIAGLPEGAIDSTEELQAVVDQLNAAIAEGQAEALDQINDWTGEETLEDVGQLLETAGITETIVPGQFLVDENLEDALFEAVQDAVVANEGDLTAEELQALVDATTADLLIENMNQFDGAATATALDALGVTGVMDSNETEVFDAVQAAIAANPNLADSVEELQAIVDQALAGLEQNSLDVVNGYAENSASNPAPVLDDYLNAGVEIPAQFEDATPAELSAMIDTMNSSVSGGDGDLSPDDLQAAFDQLAANAEVSEAKIQDYANDQTSPAPTADDYSNWNVDGTVTENNISYTNDLVASLPSDAVSAQLIMSIMDELNLLRYNPEVGAMDFDSVVDDAGNVEVQISLDKAGDGVIDRIYTYKLDDSGFLQEQESDLDADGAVDRIIYFEDDENRAPRIQSYDNDADGDIDSLIYVTEPDLNGPTPVSGGRQNGTLEYIRLADGTVSKLTQPTAWDGNGWITTNMVQTGTSYIPGDDSFEPEYTRQYNYTVDGFGNQTSFELIYLDGVTVGRTDYYDLDDAGQRIGLDRDNGSDGSIELALRYLVDDQGQTAASYRDSDINIEEAWDTLSFTNSKDYSHELDATIAADAVDLSTVTLSNATGQSELTLSDEAMSILGGEAADDSAYSLTINGDATDTVILSGGIVAQADSNVADDYAEYVGTQGGLILVHEDITDVQVVV